ncbi:uncharacterized protein LOC132295215 isoform X2 [Cornus florida]|uniref:uncharacterized protein LOC132295215 isoform X2 n=1 Tax=Cornus florida TaxID=4283 RepID=UPI00289C7520|nr:uncharacterized protein LOC132295215 isoform X2 [Cornus florida]
MAAICCYVPPSPTLQCRRAVHGFRCCSVAPNNHKKKERPSPHLLKFAVSGVTELLRFLSSPKHRSDAVSYEQRDDISVSAVDDVLMILKSDYENAYFVTGKDLYSRNLKLLVPFFDCPSIVLQKIEKGIDSETNFVFAKWKLRTYLKLPWRPFISVDGSTVYDLDNKFKIVRHAESWDISALEAIVQIFTPNFGKPGD